MTTAVNDISIFMASSFIHLCAAELNLYTEAMHQHEEWCEAMGASGRQQRRHKNSDINQVAPGSYHI